MISNVPHHVFVQGFGPARAFRGGTDYLMYKRLLRGLFETFDVAVWSYCLMPNHVHLMVVPFSVSLFEEAMRLGHADYCGYRNRRETSVAFTWRGAFSAYPMNGAEDSIRVAKFMEFNPVRAELVQHPRDYAWSSSRAHLGLGRTDRFVNAKALQRYRSD